MPAVVSHYLLAEKVYKDLQDFAPKISINKNAFFWGSFGPDIFLVHRVMPWQKGKSLTHISTRMHNYPAEKILNYIAAYSKSSDNNYISTISQSYAFGFITHYALDSIAHPYVLSLSEKLSVMCGGIHTSLCHNQIESVIDTLYLKHEKNIKISNFKLQKTAPYDRDVHEIIAKVLHGFFVANEFGNIPEEEIIKAQNDWRKILVLMNDRYSIKKRAAKIGEKALKLPPMLSPLLREAYPDLSFDYANMKNDKWFDKYKNCHNENFFELAAAAEEKSVEFIMKILDGKYLSPEDCADSFSGH